MKKILSSILLGLILTLLLCTATTYSKNDALCRKFVRVHIIANSNSPYDQAIKIGVRDEIFNHLQYDFAKFSSKEETLSYINSNLSAIEQIANDFLKSKNYEFSVKAKVKKESFPEKKYDTLLLPNGNYDALKIIIGSGSGENFFCVMFPPVCVSSGISISTGIDDIVSESEKKKLNEDVKYKLKIVEVVKEFLN